MKHETKLRQAEREVKRLQALFEASCRMLDFESMEIRAKMVQDAQWEVEYLKANAPVITQIPTGSDCIPIVPLYALQIKLEGVM